jgi:acetamidase/formamidase
VHHDVDSSRPCHRWNRDLPPVLTVAPGDTVTLALRDASDGQVRPGMTAAEFGRIDRSRIHALTGPVQVEGAVPGDTLEIEVLDMVHHGWAWTSITPGMGALGDEFSEPFLQFWELEGGRTRSLAGVTLDLHPFCGVIGVQRSEPGEFRTRVPGAFGGNMDVRHLGVGARLLLPVQAPGAGLCAGDAHAAQGDGEVSINGMEAPMTATFRLGLRKGHRLDGPYALVAPALLPPRYGTRPFHVFIESDADPAAAARAAVRRAMAYLGKRLGISRELALILCSVVLDLKISQMVNAPATTISAYLPEAIFDRPDHAPEALAG